jgi:dipeptidyl aminopeptidase/acylaminoacyl peptidase
MCSTMRDSRRGLLTASGSPSSAIAMAATICGLSRRTAAISKLTWGPFDDREPAWSHDGTRIAFSSDRGDPLGGSYNIWTLDVRRGEFRQVTKEPSEDYMPSWSPDDREIAFASTRDSAHSVWIVNVGDGGQRKVASTAAGTVDAPSWSPGGRLVYHVVDRGESRLESEGRSLTGSENAFPFRVAREAPRLSRCDATLSPRAGNEASPQTAE